ncbi:hypothetical protein LWM68_23795 [Niabella sp. W65]|nr:hypothetical protein [Niabella sp. W65]MCH7365526.1 hypothetical protein [Niabella sp. W65]
MLYEYADLQDKGSFKCNDEEINKIYDVAKYTFHLSTKEFFIDGIKRDRWVWSGDAYQSYLMNYYLTNDNATVKRTTLSLRGKDPVTSHINTIMDYTLYWFLGVYDYYLYSGDVAFVKDNYDRMKSLMAYVLGRRNKDGLLEGLPGDWVFIDWAEGLSKQEPLVLSNYYLHVASKPWRWWLIWCRKRKMQVCMRVWLKMLRRNCLIYTGTSKSRLLCTVM